MHAFCPKNRQICPDLPLKVAILTIFTLIFAGDPLLIYQQSANTRPIIFLKYLYCCSCLNQITITYFVFMPYDIQ